MGVNVVMPPTIETSKSYDKEVYWNLWERSFLRPSLGKRNLQWEKKQSLSRKIHWLSRRKSRQSECRKKKCWCEQEWNWPTTCSGCSYQWTQVNLSLATHLPSLCCLHWQWINRNPFPRYNYMTDFFVRNLEASVAKVKCWKLPRGIIRLRHPKHSSHVSRVLVKSLCFLSTN